MVLPFDLLPPGRLFIRLFREPIFSLTSSCWLCNDGGSAGARRAICSSSCLRVLSNRWSCFMSELRSFSTSESSSDKLVGDCPTSVFLLRTWGGDEGGDSVVFMSFSSNTRASASQRR